MKAVALLRQQFKFAHESFLEGTMGDVTADQAHWSPPGTALPVAALYAHIILEEDMMLSGMLKGSAPLVSAAWAGKAGVSELPPQMPPWDQWARRLRADLPAMRDYAKAVYANTDKYLATLSDEDLDRPIDLSPMGMGNQTVGFVLSLLLGNVDHHCGEISCLKGLQGAKGYPF